MDNKARKQGLIATTNPKVILAPALSSNTSSPSMTNPKAISTLSKKILASSNFNVCLGFEMATLEI